MSKMPTKRAEIPEKYKWDMTAVYADEAAFEADFAKAEQLIVAFAAHGETMLKSAEQLCAALDDYYAFIRLAEKLYEYAGRNFDVDTSVNAMQALSARVMDMFRRAGAVSYFVTPNLLKLDEETLEKWYAECPALAKYRRVISVELRRKPHTLSDECEKLLADVSTGMGGHSNIYSILTDCDMTFGKIRGEGGKVMQLTDSNYIPCMMSQDRRVRRAAFNKLYEGYGQFGNTIATVINSFIKEHTTLARIRGYESALHASTFEDEVTPEIYNNLIDTVSRNLPVLFEYYELKRRILGLSQLHMYDVYPPLVADYDKEYSYEEAVDEVLDTVKVFGEEYHSTLSKGLLEDRWCDVFPNDAKRGGAYSAGAYDTDPHILLNFNGKLDDVSTLAHEAGHSMHSYMSRKYNDFHESDYKIFVAEVASTVNELLMTNKKLRESENDTEKLSLLNHLMETFKGTLFRQTMFAEFEKLLYAKVEAGIPLTCDLVCDEYYAIIKKYFGPKVVCDKPIAREWMRIPHFYYNFYVYKYATCISAAASIVKRIEEQGDAYISQYIDFLKCGGSRSPLDSLKVAGIDMTSPAVVEDAISLFADTVAQFRELAEKLGMMAPLR